MFGYALFHVSLLLEYFAIRKESLENWKAKLYVIVVVLTIAFYLFMFMVLVHALAGPHAKPIDKWAATIDSAAIPAKITGGLRAYHDDHGAWLVMPNGKTQHISAGWRGWGLVIVTA